MVKKIKNKLIQLPKDLLIGIIIGLRPLFGSYGSCRFAVTCSEYAILQLKTERIHIALFNITKRLCMCSPFYKLFK